MLPSTELSPYIERGFKLVPIPAGAKAPNAQGWNTQERMITSTTQLKKLAKAQSPWLQGNIGVHLKSSGLCSLDIDDMDLSRKALSVVGIDPEKVLAAGWLVRGNPERGRVLFKAPAGLSTSHKLICTVIGEDGKAHRKTIFELRGFADHEQDVLPPSIHPETRKPYTAGPLPEVLPEPPQELTNFWHDFESLKPQLLRIIGSDARFDKYGSQHLRHKHDLAGSFNRTVSVAELLERNGYELKRSRNGMRARHPASTSGSYSARQIPGTEGLWQSDNGNDPLYGLFDAWSAFVDLEHSGEPEKAAQAWKKELARKEHRPLLTKKKKPGPDFMEEMFTATQLIDSDIKAPPFRVDELFPAGVYILAGDIKLGKSYLMAQACLAISTGSPLLGCKTRQCTTLMLDLEGAPTLLKTRLDSMPKALGIQAPLDKALFKLSWPRGLEAIETLDKLLEQDPSLRFVVIDTLARVRDDTGASGNQYNLDYNQVSGWADLRKKYEDLTIIIIHHVRKMTSDDAHDMVSGTFGLGGAVDGTFVLLRPNRTGGSRLSEQDRPELKNLAEFYGRTRWTEELSWVLQRKPINEEARDKGFVWALSSVKPWEIIISIEHNRILEVMKEDPDKLWTAKEIAERLNKRAGTVGVQLHTMGKRGLVSPSHGMGWRLVVQQERKF
jgi:hypothetical protein